MILKSKKINFVQILKITLYMSFFFYKYELPFILNSSTSNLCFPTYPTRLCGNQSLVVLFDGWDFTSMLAASWG